MKKKILGGIAVLAIAAVAANVNILHLISKIILREKDGVVVPVRWMFYFSIMLN